VRGVLFDVAIDTERCPVIKAIPLYSFLRDVHDLHKSSLPHCPASSRAFSASLKFTNDRSTRASQTSVNVNAQFSRSLWIHSTHRLTSYCTPHNREFSNLLHSLSDGVLTQTFNAIVRYIELASALKTLDHITRPHHSTTSLDHITRPHHSTTSLDHITRSHHSTTSLDHITRSHHSTTSLGLSSRQKPAMHSKQ